MTGTYERKATRTEKQEFVSINRNATGQVQVWRFLSVKSNLEGRGSEVPFLGEESRLKGGR